MSAVESRRGGLELGEHERLDELGDEALSPLGRTHGLYGSPAWLRYCERTAGGQMRFVTARRGERLVGLAPVRQVGAGGGLSLYDVGSFVADAELQLQPSAISAISGASPPLVVDERLPRQEALAVQRALAEGVAEAARASGARTAGILYLDDADATEAAGAGLGAGAQTLVVDAHARLDADWTAFDGYVASLRSGRRNTVRRERREYLASGLETAAVEGSAGLDGETARLQLQLRERYGVSSGVRDILRDYENLAATVDDHLVVFRATDERGLVGLSLCLLDGERLHVRLAGFAYDRLPPAFVYFNVVYYEPIVWGLERGIASFRFGTGTYDAKRHRGCALLPSYAAVLWPADCRDAASASARELEARLLAEIRA